MSNYLVTEIALLLGMLGLSVPLGRKIYLQTRRKYLTSFLAILFLELIALIIAAIGAAFGFMFSGGSSGLFGQVVTAGFEMIGPVALGALLIRWLWDAFHTPSADDYARAELKDPNIENF